MARILITGVRGKTGAPLAELLAARSGVEVRGGSSDPTGVTADGVVPTAFSWDDPAGWPAATEGIDAVYVVRPDRADAPDLVAELLSTTPRDARVVLLSEQDTDSFAPDHWARRVERAVRESGHPWTMLRPSWFMQVLVDPRFYLDDVSTHGRLPFAGGGARVAWVDARDIAAVAEHAVLDDAHDGLALEITGPEALTLPETAGALSAALGRPVEHEEIAVEEAVDGMSGFERDETVWTLERLREGGFADVADTVGRVTGRPARSIATFAADHRGLLASS